MLFTSRIQGDNRKRFISRNRRKLRSLIIAARLLPAKSLDRWLWFGPVRKVLFKAHASPDQRAKVAMAPTTEKTGTFSPPGNGSRINQRYCITWKVFLWRGISKGDGCIDEIDRSFSSRNLLLRRTVLISRYCRWHEQRTCCPTSRTSSPSIPQKRSSLYKDKSRPISHQGSVRVCTLQTTGPDITELLHTRSESLNCWGTTRINEHANSQRNAYESFCFSYLNS